MQNSAITLLVSIDGVAPRHITPMTMPALITAARKGASCYDARTITPSLTLPAHASMLRGVNPQQHGIFSNTPEPIKTPAPTLLKQAREHQFKTASLNNWSPFECIFEEDAVDEKFSIDGGYSPLEDERICAATLNTIQNREHQVIFTYLAQCDLAGHEFGWDSVEYIAALKCADQCLNKMIAALRPNDSLVVTTDHGGLGKHHEQSRIEDLQTFIAVSSPNISPTSFWPSASILDIAPTIADLAGFPKADTWEGTSLIGTEQFLIEHFLELLRESASHNYGENLNMLDHALQTASLAKRDGCEDSMVLACLLHDLGHLMGEAGEWGLPSHAEVAAQRLQQLFNPAIYEPIRLHVAAKRFLVATDSQYRNELSKASIASLEEQGGAFSEAEQHEFNKLQFAPAAIQLRRYDDHGKCAGLEVPSLDSFHNLLEQALKAPIIDSMWARDACQCNDCRSEENGQHFIHATDLRGWNVVAENYSAAQPKVRLVHDDGGSHLCVLPRSGRRRPLPLTLWGADFAKKLSSSAVAAKNNSDDAIQQLVEFGITLIQGVDINPDEVLKFASQLGYVRETNYGKLFDVVAEPSPINLAYTPLGLPLHTDNPYRHPCPGVQLLHCLQNASDGGASQFADGFKSASLLRQHHPKQFLILCEQNVKFSFQDESTCLHTSKPIIELDNHGEIIAVRVNNRSMQAPQISAAESQSFYEAYLMFTDLLASDQLAFEITLQPGDLIVFDNSRVLHGRKAYKVSEPRHLQGCYIDIDAVRSRYYVANAS